MTIQEHLVSILILMQVQVSALEDLEKVLPREDFEKIKKLSQVLVKNIITSFGDLIKSQWKIDEGEQTSIELIVLYESIAMELAKAKLADLPTHLRGIQSINTGDFKFEENERE